MRRLGITAVLVLAGILFFLTVAQHEEKGNEALAAGGAGHPADALMRADADFDQATAEKGIDGWVSCFAEDGAMMPAGGNIVRGREAIRALMAPSFANPGFSLRWKPVGAEISSADDLGYTFGTYIATSAGPDGKLATRYGKYLTVWKKQADGSWKVVNDIGNSSPAPDTEKK